MTRSVRALPLIAVLGLMLPAALAAQNQGSAQVPDPVAQEAERLMDLLRQEALLVEISATVVDQNREVIWFTEIREITVFGKQVQVRINGSHLTVHADFTPYVHDSRQLMLLAQGQTWIRSQETDFVSYQSALRSIPIVLGESVLFYPLGIDLTQASLGKAVLELEVTVRSLAEALSTAQQSGGQTNSEGQTNSTGGSGPKN